MEEQLRRRGGGGEHEEPGADGGDCGDGAVGEGVREGTEADHD